jgi:hypothetical protein
MLDQPLKVKILVFLFLVCSAFALGSRVSGELQTKRNRYVVNQLKENIMGELKGDNVQINIEKYNKIFLWLT